MNVPIFHGTSSYSFFVFLSDVSCLIECCWYMHMIRYLNGSETFTFLLEGIACGTVELYLQDFLLLVCLLVFLISLFFFWGQIKGETRSCYWKSCTKQAQMYHHCERIGFIWWAIYWHASIGFTNFIFFISWLVFAKRS